jgi:hypothetical protein
MTITVEQLQIAGIVVVVLIGLGFVGWLVRTVVGVSRGSPVYMLPDTSNNTDDNAADDNEDPDHVDIHIHPR